jgi:type IV secretory pathway VirB6-like protein
VKRIIRLIPLLLAVALLASAQNAMPVNPDSTDYTSFVTQRLNDLLSVGAPYLASYGMNIVNSFGGMMFSLLLIRWAYQAYNHHHFTINPAPIVGFLFLIATIDTMLFFYATPIPGVGVSFSQLPAKVAMEITSFLDQGVYSALMSRLHVFMTNLQEPTGTFNLQGFFMYGVVFLNITGAETILFGVTIFGYVYYALAVLLGPIFVSALMFPMFSRYFHSWLSVLLRFAFYQVAAKALVFIWANVLVSVIDQFIGGDYSLSNAFSMAIPFIMLNLSMLFVCFNIPHFVDNLFSGSASAGHGGLSAVIPRIASRMF